MFILRPIRTPSTLDFHPAPLFHLCLIINFLKISTLLVYSILLDYQFSEKNSPNSFIPYCSFIQYLRVGLHCVRRSSWTVTTLATLSFIASKVIIYRNRTGSHGRFGLILGRLAILKKNWPDYDQVLKAVFSSFHGQKNIQNSVASSLKICILLFYRLFLWIFGGLKIG